jgi:hypothetical protein
MVKRTVFMFVVVSCMFGLALAAKKNTKGDEEKSGTLTLSIRDFCDPTTFNAILGPGACAREDNVSVDGSQTFTGFISEVGQEKSAGSWRFNPISAKTEEGVNLTLVNRGGETHTFTRVAEFGGGFVAALNAPSGNPVPRPECAKMVNGQLVPQSPSSDNIFINHGQSLMGPRIVGGERAKFQCCIHPWMRFTINPDGSRRDD